MDTHSPEVRSFNMSRIRSKNTKPEELVRKYLFSHGLRYRINDKRYPGKPDIVLPKYNTVVFINGCFWHCHEGHPCFVMPKSKLRYWKPKFKRNKQRDAENIAALKKAGWRIIIVWECELKRPMQDKTLKKLYNKILNGKRRDGLYRKSI